MDEPSLASSDTSHFSPVLERIDDRAFSYCDSLENVSFPPALKTPLRNKYYAENGFIRFEIEIHGLDPRLPAETFQEISKGFNDANGGYLANGLEDKDRYYMRHVYQGLVRCIDFLTSLPEWDGKNVAVQGGSQGGALAIVAAGLDSRVTQCVANHPALSDMATPCGTP